jgi:hypothetical protein
MALRGGISGGGGSSSSVGDSRSPMQTGLTAAGVRNVKRSKAKHFACLGTRPSVPRYLRLEGKVKSRNLTKRQVEAIVKDVWSKRRTTGSALSAGGGGSGVPTATVSSHGKDSFTDAFYEYLLRRYGVHNIAADWGYNIVNALEKYSYSFECSVFNSVLNGAPEELWYAWC